MGIPFFFFRHREHVSGSDSKVEPLTCLPWRCSVLSRLRLLVCESKGEAEPTEIRWLCMIWVSEIISAPLWVLEIFCVSIGYVGYPMTITSIDNLGAPRPHPTIDYEIIRFSICSSGTCDKQSFCFNPPRAFFSRLYNILLVLISVGICLPFV